MNDTPFTAIAFLCILVCFIFLFMGGAFGAVNEQSRIQRKCLVEMQDKSHKEATEICSERVK